ncbi:glycosyl hydrolase family 28-related protein [Luteibacter pinisoli]|uniref:glycosyl hydrolase family 28-related protein n=1 Tax=Luteibacter pinisoli TaxID=2589080 RepID=UPI0014769C12|nr:glycosyl hydrolase family 28-related protein [Luteibacter pinisoli]
MLARSSTSRTTAKEPRMTVNSTVSTASYTGNGTTSAFPVPFYFLLDTDLKVTKKSVLTGASTVLNLNSDYTLMGAGNQAGGSLQMLAPPAANDKLFIERNIPFVQQTAYPPNDRFPSAAHEKALDRDTMSLQQLQSQLARALVSDPLGTTYDLKNNTLVNSGAAVNDGDIPTLQQVRSLVVGGAAPILVGPSGSSTVGFIQSGVNAVARTVQDKARETYSVKDFGAKGDGATDDAAAIQAAINAAIPAGASVYFPKGRYLINSTVTIDLTAHSSEVDGKGLNLYGAGSGNTVIVNGTNYVGLDVVGTMATAALYSYFKVVGIAITKTGAGTGDIGMRIAKSYGVYFNDVVFLTCSVGFTFTDCVLMTLVSSHFRFCTRGLFAAGQVDPSGSTPNAITLVGCIFYGQVEYAAWFEKGCNVVFVGGSVETTAGGVGAQRFGVKINLAGVYGRAACAFYGTYFERNGNTADVWMVNGDNPCTYLFSGCTFNRLTAAEISTNALLLETNGNTAARVYLTVEGCAFSRYGTYTPNAARPYIATTGATPIIFRDIGNMYTDNLERPVQPSCDPLARVRFVGSTGAITRQQNVISVSRGTTGQYTINFRDSNTSIGGGRTVNITTDIGGFNWVLSETATAVTIQCTNSAGTNTDPGSVSVVVYE